MKDIRCYDGRPLPTFHRDLLAHVFDAEILHAVVDGNELVGPEGTRGYYERLFALVSVTAVQAESYLVAGPERGFTFDVVMPAIEATIARFGAKPIITRLLPLELEQESNWERYPPEALPLAKTVACFNPKMDSRSVASREPAAELAPLYIAPTRSTGLGLFTRHPHFRNQTVFVLSGQEQFLESTSEEHAASNPNWIGIDRNRWIDPEGYYQFINHCCAPNLGVRGERKYVALRDISAGEELTFDYSTSEDELLWSMECSCMKPNCRKVIRSIQYLPSDILERYKPYVSSYFVDIACRAPVSSG